VKSSASGTLPLSASRREVFHDHQMTADASPDHRGKLLSIRELPRPQSGAFFAGSDNKDVSSMYLEMLAANPAHVSDIDETVSAAVATPGSSIGAAEDLSKPSVKAPRARLQHIAEVPLALGRVDGFRKI
jgi:hypothetical protein